MTFLTAYFDTLSMPHACPDAFAYSDWQLPAFELLIDEPETNDKLLTIEDVRAWERNKVIDLLKD